MSYRPYDAIIQQASSQGAAGARVELYQDTGLTITALTPVTVDDSGNIKPIDVSDEADAIKTLGLTTEDIFGQTSGEVCLLGRIDNVTIPYNFGDYLYVSKTGEITNILPTEGANGFVAGDFVIRLGVVARNSVSPSNKDILVFVSVIGQL